ncbi:MAG: NAD(P)/FAD-dependent oxidoreductase [Deltaproteobacteria bacterium]|nr:NAD(P)/FAD-dependent oxidoreductase [Deltaproteobacteria bacterium]
MYDAIIIGGGHNGLTHAAYLARAGKKVLVLERRHIVGGAAVTEEIYPGFKYSACSYVVSLLRPEVIRELNLANFGLAIVPLDSTFTPLPEGNYLARWGDHDKTRREIMRHSPVDAEAYEQFGKLMHQLAMMVKPILATVPPDVTSLHPRELFKLLSLARHFRKSGGRLLYHMTKLMTMSSADFLSEWFETEVLKATMSASGIIGTFLGPRSPGTAYVLLHHYVGEIDATFRSWGWVRGGMGNVSQSIAASAQRHGAEIRTRAAVARVLVKSGKVAGGRALPFRSGICKRRDEH